MWNASKYGYGFCHRSFLSETDCHVFINVTNFLSLAIFSGACKCVRALCVDKQNTFNIPHPSLTSRPLLISALGTCSDAFSCLPIYLKLFHWKKLFLKYGGLLLVDSDDDVGVASFLRSRSEGVPTNDTKYANRKNL